MRRAAFAVLRLMLVLAPPAAAHGGDAGEVTHADTRQELADVDVAAVARATQRAAAPHVAADAEGLTRTWSCTARSTDDLPALTLHAGEGQRVRVRLTLRSLTHRASATTRGTVLLDL